MQSHFAKNKHLHLSKFYDTIIVYVCNYFITSNYWKVYDNKRRFLIEFATKKEFSLYASEN